MLREKVPSLFEPFLSRRAGLWVGATFFLGGIAASIYDFLVPEYLQFLPFLRHEKDKYLGNFKSILKELDSPDPVVQERGIEWLGRMLGNGKITAADDRSEIIGRLKEFAGQKGESGKAAQQALAKAVQWRKGFLIRMGRPDETIVAAAVSELHSILGDTETLHFLFREGELKTAVKAASRSVIQGQNRKLYLGILVGEGSLEQAIKEQRAYIDILNRRLAPQPERAEAYAGLGNLYFLKGQREEAEGNYRIAFSFDKGNFAALAGLAEVALKRKGGVEALRWLTQAKVQPEEEKQYQDELDYNTALALWLQEDASGALGVLKGMVDKVTLPGMMQELKSSRGRPLMREKFSGDLLYFLDMKEGPIAIDDPFELGWLVYLWIHARHYERGYDLTERVLMSHPPLFLNETQDSFLFDIEQRQELEARQSPSLTLYGAREKGAFSHGARGKEAFSVIQQQYFRIQNGNFDASKEVQLKTLQRKLSEIPGDEFPGNVDDELTAWKRTIEDPNKPTKVKQEGFIVLARLASFLGEEEKLSLANWVIDQGEQLTREQREFMFIALTRIIDGIRSPELRKFERRFRRIFFFSDPDRFSAAVLKKVFTGLDEKGLIALARQYARQLEDPSPLQRRRAIVLLCLLDIDELDREVKLNYYRQIAKRMEDADPTVRSLAHQAVDTDALLGLSTQEERMEIFRKAVDQLTDPNPKTREQAFDSFSGIHSLHEKGQKLEVIDRVVEKLRGANPDVVDSVVGALGWLIRALVDQRDLSPDDLLRIAEKISKMLKDPRPRTRLAATIGLSKIVPQLDPGSRSHYARLVVEMLSDPHPEVRSATAVSFEKVATLLEKDAFTFWIRRLADHLQDEDPRVRRSAVSTLVNMMATTPHLFNEQEQQKYKLQIAEALNKETRKK